MMSVFTSSFYLYRSSHFTCQTSWPSKHRSNRHNLCRTQRATRSSSVLSQVCQPTLPHSETIQMAPKYHSSSTAGISISHANEYVTSPAALPITLPPARSGPFLVPGQCTRTGPSPAQPYTEHDLEAVGPNSTTPPPSYTELSLRVIAGDSKTLPHAYNSPFPSLHSGPSPNPDEDGSSLHVGAPEEPSSLRVGVTVLLCFIKYSFIVCKLTLAVRRKAV